MKEKIELRHVCNVCGKKRKESKMINWSKQKNGFHSGLQTRYRKDIWVCRGCDSNKIYIY